MCVCVSVELMYTELSDMRVDIFGDNESSKVISDSLGSASRSKHIDVKFHLI